MWVAGRVEVRAIALEEGEVFQGHVDLKTEETLQKNLVVGGSGFEDGPSNQMAPQPRALSHCEYGASQTGYKQRREYQREMQ